jgi:hypothetical protein
MNVSIKNFAVTMDIKNAGMELDVYDTSGTHLGDLVISKTKLIWCNGKTTRRKGKPIKWSEFIKYMNERP